MPIYRPTPKTGSQSWAVMQPGGSTQAAATAQPVPQTPVPNAPAAPVLTQAPGIGLTATWAAPAGDSTHGAATSYNLRYSLSGAGQWTVVSGVSSPYGLSGLTAGTAYDVQVQAANTGGTSAWSPTSTQATAAGAPNAPAAPMLSLGSGSNLSVIWLAPATDTAHGAATSYNLRSAPSGTGNWTVVSGVASPYTLTGLGFGAATDVQVQAVNATGSGAWSATATLTTSAGAPNAPAAPVLTQGGTSGTLSVAWTAPATDTTHGAATSYNLRSAPSGTGTWTTVTGVTSPYSLTGLSASAAYDVEVQAANGTGTGAWSTITTLTTAAAGPNVPAITSVSAPPDGTAGKLKVVWTAPATDSTHGAATGYNLRYSPTGAGTWTVLSAVTSPATVTGLTGGAAYDVEVQATNASTIASAWSAITTATTWGATVAPGSWQPAATQVHGTSMAPSGGAQMVAVAAPTAVTGGAFAWSTSATVLPTSGLIAAGADGQTNGYGAYMSAPASAGTYYLWMMAQGASSATIGALVTGAITVS